MPIYEYRCKECHQIFEEWTTNAGDQTPLSCPVCDNQAGRIMSAASFAVNGEECGVASYEAENRKEPGEPADGACACGSASIAAQNPAQ